MLSSTVRGLRFIIVYKDAGRNIHGVAQQQPFLNTALLKGLLNLGSNVDILSSFSGLKTQFFSIGFQVCFTSSLFALRSAEISRPDPIYFDPIYFSIDRVI